MLYHQLYAIKESDCSSEFIKVNSQLQSTYFLHQFQNFYVLKEVWLICTIDTKDITAW